MEPREPWMDICALAAVEMDSNKLLALAAEVDCLLEEKERTAKGMRTPLPRLSRKTTLAHGLAVDIGKDEQQHSPHGPLLERDARECSSSAGCRSSRSYPTYEGRFHKFQLAHAATRYRG